MNYLEMGKTIFELYHWFNLLNEHYYENQLETPVISIWLKRKNETWHATKKRERNVNNNHAFFYEMAIPMELECINGLITPEIINDLLHEMVHLYNLQHEINDTSNRHQYHNKSFKNVAITHGLRLEQVVCGTNRTSLNEDAKKFIESVVGKNILAQTSEKPSEPEPQNTRGKIRKNKDIFR